MPGISNQIDGSSYPFAKRAIDICLGILLLAPVLVICGIAALAIYLDDPGPPLHLSVRVGRNGRTFTLLKLRTMVRAAPDGPAITVLDDPRRTRVGRILRRTHLDELPQVVNVLLGDMSFVGPRPEDPKFVRHYSPAERQVLQVRPGIAGLSQLKYRDESRLISPADPEGSYVRNILRAKAAIDRIYVQNADPVLDLQIAWHTFLLVVFGRQADRFLDSVLGRGSAS